MLFSSPAVFDSHHSVILERLSWLFFPRHYLRRYSIIDLTCICVPSQTDIVLFTLVLL